MQIRAGDKGELVRQAQRQLNKVGSLLEEDGVFGKGCILALANCCRQMNIPPAAIYTDEVDSWLSDQPDPLPGVDNSAVTFIAREEIGSYQTYTTSGSAPCYPGGESGITIGIGYDLRAQVQSFAADWQPHLPAGDFLSLQAMLGKTGTAALVSSLRSIHVPWDAAWYVFTRRTLPDTLAQLERAFPGQEELSPLSRGALVSLVYNRGTSFAGDRRREMAAIRDAIQARQFDKVEPQFLAMRRLWPNFAGLCKRREKEGEMFSQGLA